MELDEFRLVSLDSVRKKQVYLLQYLSKLEKELIKSSTQGVLNQTRVEEDLMKCVLLPGCGSDTIRKLIAKCLVTLYSVGEGKSLFDMFIKLQSHVELTKDSKVKMYIEAYLGH